MYKKIFSETNNELHGGYFSTAQGSNFTEANPEVFRHENKDLHRIMRAEALYRRLLDSWPGSILFRNSIFLRGISTSQKSLGNIISTS
jgi:hypothetical protein